jgi:CRP-like cAMP-binding protein
MDITEQLAEIPLFKGVDRADREALIGVMSRQSYQPGELLFKQGDPGDSMYILLKGRVRIFTTDEQGNEYTIRYLNRMVGEWSVLDQQPRSTSVAAENDVEALILRRDDFIAFLRARPLVGLALMRDLAERVRYTTSYLQKVLDATERLSRGEYEPTLQETPDSGADTGIQEMIATFLQMADHVKQREDTLKGSAGEAKPMSD